MKASRPGALLLDGGDTWQGSADGALDRRARTWSMPASLLGVDVMTGALGVHATAPGPREADRRSATSRGRHGLRRPERQDHGGFRAIPSSRPFVIRRDQRRAGGHHRAGVSLHADRQPAAGWCPTGPSASRTSRSCRRPSTRRVAKGATGSGRSFPTTAWMWTSSSPSRVTGIDAILGGHTHDGVPQPDRREANAGRSSRWSPMPGPNGKFLGVLDFDVRRAARIADWKLSAAAGVLEPAARPTPQMAGG
jgi:sulfur-oxidizing protein SoxB